MNLTHLLMLAGAVALSACHSSSPATPDAGASAGSASGAEALPDAKPGVTLTGARLVLPAVSGNPGALYFTLANRGAAPVTLAAIHVDGAARAEAHETVGGTMRATPRVNVPAGGQVAFAPGGRHVMLFGLSTSLVVHGATEMTLTFAGGDKASAPVAVVAAGSGDAPMAM